jgi:hypothetical protein
MSVRRTAGGRVGQVNRLVVAAPRRSAYGLLLLAGVLAAATALSDPGGRLLTAPAALAALVLGLRGLDRRPLLLADAGGIAVRDGWRRLTAPWDGVERMRVVRDRRAALLELDLGHTLVVLSQARLGRLPEDVLTELLAVRSLRR